MEAAAVTSSKRAASDLLLRHCFAFEGERPSAAARLEALLGRDLAEKLVAALCPRR